MNTDLANIERLRHTIEQLQKVLGALTKQHETTKFSRATMEVAKNNLKEFESQADEAFLIRADMDRKITSI